jgi:hypothetical protein
MKPTKKPDSDTISFSKQLKNHFADEQIASFVLTLLGMSDLAHRFIWEKAREFIELPIEVKYSTIQHAAFFRILSMAVQGELDKDKLDLKYMPVNKDAWESDEDFEKRFIFVVKHYYEGLKKEGKL